MGQGGSHATGRSKPLQRFINAHEEVTKDSLEGFLRFSPVPVAIVEGFPAIKVLVREGHQKSRVAIVTGSGAGHEPADVYYLGEGMAAAVAVGTAYRPPTADCLLQAIAAVTGEAGCLLLATNYFGDRLNCELAMELAKERLGLRVRAIYVADDVVGMPDVGNRAEARGIAGTVMALKVAGAAAAAGCSLEEVYEEGLQAANSIATIGVAFSRGKQPLQEYSKKAQEDTMEVGVGVRSEPGCYMLPAKATAKDIVDLMIARLEPFTPGDGPVCAMVNNLGAVAQVEMNILAKQVLQSELAPRVQLILGPAAFYTAMNTNGFSLSLMSLTEQRRQRLEAPTEAPGWKRPLAPRAQVTTIPSALSLKASRQTSQPSEQPDVYRLLAAMCHDLMEGEDEFASMSAKVSTGEMGQAVARFARHLLAVMPGAPLGKPGQLFDLLADECANEAGIMFQVARIVLNHASTELGPSADWELNPVVTALVNGVEKARTKCDVQLQKRTFFDALVPAMSVDVEEFEDVSEGEATWVAWLRAAACQARFGARATADMTNAIGWAAHTPLWQRTGTPDGGAVVIATIFTALDAPSTGSFRKLPEKPLPLGTESAHVEAMAREDLARGYELGDMVDALTKTQSRVRVAKALIDGPHRGQQVVIREQRTDEEELGVKSFRNSLVMERRRMLNWLFRQKPHIVNVYEVIITPLRCYYVMENVPGQSLIELLESEGRLGITRAMQLLRQILLSIQDLHHRRMVHRDIKPENFRFDKNGELKLIDVCGTICHLSQSYDMENGRSKIHGTLAYMSPETLDGAGRQAADMWAVGVTLHLMLVGCVPFQGTTVEEARQAVSKPLDVSGSLWKDVPGPAKDLVRKLLRHNARSRLTVDEALEDPLVADLDERESEEEGETDSTDSPPDIVPDSEDLAAVAERLKNRGTLLRWRQPSANWSVQMGGCVTKTLYLIRHGEAMHNIEEKKAKKAAIETLKAQGVKPGSEAWLEFVEKERKGVLHNDQFYDASLSALGRHEALHGQSELAGLHDRGLPRPTAILTSPLLRTLETASIIFPFHSCVHVREDLRERRTGLPCDSRLQAVVRERQQRFQQMDFSDVCIVDAENTLEYCSLHGESRGDSLGDIGSTPPSTTPTASTTTLLFKKIDHAEIAVADDAEEAKSELRKRTGRFLNELRTLHIRDEALGAREHEAIAAVTHKGFLREMERGPLGHPKAAEFANCEVRVYEVTWNANGEVQTPAKLLYSNASLCTIKLQRLPIAWLPKPTGEAAASQEANLPMRLRALLREHGELREDPLVEIEAPTAREVRKSLALGKLNGAASPRRLTSTQSTEGKRISATAVFVERSAAANAENCLNGLDGRNEDEQRFRPAPHEADRVSARVLYDLEHETWGPSGPQRSCLHRVASKSASLAARSRAAS
eukprot:TRINITY_DN25287_c0_g1_i1.p1 TRINITY_DN25287_c0_g1~~TRINITY_DN25287_c0_g1_i1.p1  ORF type:complete len:1418 (-),score=248.97 TRINITY_DN25287_c0_g1_i1:25-4278(-)